MLKNQGIDRLLSFLIILLLLTAALFSGAVYAADNLSDKTSPSASPSKQTSLIEQPEINLSSDSNSDKVLPETPPASKTGESGSNSNSTVLSTSFKRYSLCRYKENYILCEPYTVQEGDWIYKIFRSKGELSKEDFGLFLKIFKEINPDIKDINTIKKGQSITIPLKRSSRNDFKESKPGVVDLPIITLSKLPDKLRKGNKPAPPDLSTDTYRYSANYVSSGEKGANLITKKRSSIPVNQLKEFAMINNGQLMMKGKYYFPRESEDDLVIDVAFNPLINLKGGSRIIFVPEKNSFEKTAETIKMFWRDLKIMDFDELDTSLNGRQSSSYYATALPGNSNTDNMQSSLSSSTDFQDAYVPIPGTVPEDHKAAVKELLSVAGYRYEPETEIDVDVGDIKVKTTLGVVEENGVPKIYIVFGDIFGSVFDALKKTKKAEIVSISPMLKTMDATNRLFTALGCTLTANPSFISPSTGRALSINGIYIKGDHGELFITEKQMVPREAFKYLSEKNIALLTIDNKKQ